MKGSEWGLPPGCHPPAKLVMGTRMPHTQLGPALSLSTHFFLTSQSPTCQLPPCPVPGARPGSRARGRLCPGEARGPVVRGLCLGPAVGSGIVRTLGWGRSGLVPICPPGPSPGLAWAVLAQQVLTASEHHAGVEEGAVSCGLGTSPEGTRCGRRRL